MCICYSLMRSTHIFQHEMYFSFFVCIKSLHYTRKCIFLHHYLSGGVIGIIVVNFATNNARHKVTSNCLVCFLNTKFCITDITLWTTKMASSCIKNVCICRAHYKFWARQCCHPKCKNGVTEIPSQVVQKKHLFPLRKTNLRTQMQNLLLWFLPFLV